MRFAPVLFLVPAVLSLPFVERDVTFLSTSDVDALAPYTQFARAGYCSPSSTLSWSCGEACDANSGFQTIASGGDGDGVQYYFIGYWPAKNTAVVVHQGTDPTQLKADLTDADIPKTSLDSSIFPNLPDGLEAHEGFVHEHAKTASVVLSSVQQVINSNGASSVTLIGHSLGGALALLDTLMFAQQMPSTPITMVTFGMPRVGNPAFASYVSSLPVSLTRVTNNHDVVPIIPGRFLDFNHPIGEVHINDDSTTTNSWAKCPGIDDADDTQCEIQNVPDISEGSISDHLGPYNGVYMGTIYCT